MDSVQLVNLCDAHRDSKGVSAYGDGLYREHPDKLAGQALDVLETQRRTLAAAVSAARRGCSGRWPTRSWPRAMRSLGDRRPRHDSKVDPGQGRHHQGGEGQGGRRRGSLSRPAQEAEQKALYVVDDPADLAALDSWLFERAEGERSSLVARDGFDGGDLR